MALACSSTSSGAKATGELGNGTFDYTCARASDPVCAGGAVASNFPDCLMEGGEFEIDYTIEDLDELESYGTDFIYVKPASPTYFDGVDALTAIKTGRAALVAYADDNVIDILHLAIVPPTSMSITNVDTTVLGPVVELEVGESLILSATANSSACAQAGGGLRVSSTSSDPGVVTVGGLDVVALSGIAEGSATITVQMGPLTQDLEVRVGPAVSTTASDTETSDTEATDTEASATETGDTSGATDTSDTGGSDTGASDTDVGTSSETGTETGTETGSTGGAT